MPRKPNVTEADIRRIDDTGELTLTLHAYIDDLTHGRVEPIEDPMELVRKLTSLASAAAGLANAVAYRAEFDRKQAEFNALMAKRA